MDPMNETIAITTWKLLSKKIEELNSVRVSRIQSYYEQLTNHGGLKLNITPNCDESITLLFNQAKLSQEWAVKSE